MFEIDIDDVYQTVLTILNKEQRGYLDPEEFNRLAVIAQRGIFEQYFTKYSGAPSLGPTVADPALFIEEKIKYFEEVADLDEQEDIDSFINWPDDFYRVGVITTGPTQTYPGIVIDNVGHAEIAYINQSQFTKPSEKQPVYVIHDAGIQVWPKDDANAITQVTMVYMRIPQQPNWTYDETVFMDEQEIVYRHYNEGQLPADSPQKPTQNFELHPSEFHELVIKICAYAGVVIRAQDVTGFAQQQEQQIQQLEQ